jgi:hypothetical protein
MLMAVRQRHLQEPSSIRLFLHGMRLLIPLIKIPGQKYLLRVGSIAVEVDGF